MSPARPGSTPPGTPPPAARAAPAAPPARCRTAASRARPIRCRRMAARAWPAQNALRAPQVVPAPVPADRSLPPANGHMSALWDSGGTACGCRCTWDKDRQRKDGRERCRNHHCVIRCDICHMHTLTHQNVQVGQLAPPPKGCIGRGAGTPPPGRPAYAQPLSP